MNLEERLDRLKTDVLKRIESAAKDNNSKSVVDETRVLEELERLNSELLSIKRALDNLENPPQSRVFPETVGMRRIRFPKSTADAGVSFRAQGKARKEEFLQELKTAGTTLVHEGGSKYREESGGLVGIAYASERQPRRWFLGLPAKDYVALVLLCETETGKVLKFILPADFFKQYRDRFSNVNGQLKFNVVTRGEKYQMLIPGVDAITINSYLGNYRPLMT